MSGQHKRASTKYTGKSKEVKHFLQALEATEATLKVETARDLAKHLGGWQDTANLSVGQCLRVLSHEHFPGYEPICRSVVDNTPIADDELELLDDVEPHPVRQRTAPTHETQHVAAVGGDFTCGTLAAGVGTVRALLASGRPVALKVAGLEGTAQFDKELRAQSSVWSHWVGERPSLDKSESQLANLSPDHPNGRAIWCGVCEMLGMHGDSPDGATVVGSLMAASGRYRTPLHWHVPAVCNLALGGTAVKHYLLIPFEVADELDLVEGNHSSLSREALLARLGPHAANCWSTTIGASADYNCVLWPVRMLHLVITEQPQRLRRSAPAATGLVDADEGPRRALYLGFGSYIFDRANMHDLLQAFADSRERPSWYKQFKDQRALQAFEEWYASRAAVESESSCGRFT